MTNPKKIFIIEEAESKDSVLMPYEEKTLALQQMASALAETINHLVKTERLQGLNKEMINPSVKPRLHIINRWPADPSMIIDPGRDIVANIQWHTEGNT